MELARALAVLRRRMDARSETAEIDEARTAVFDDAPPLMAELP
jgi:hypothetical protein